MKFSRNPLIWLMGIVLVVLIITYFQPDNFIPLGAPPICGDGACGGGDENCLTCAEDCGQCPPEAYPGFTTPSLDLSSLVSRDTFTSAALTVKEGVVFEGVNGVIKKIDRPASVPSASEGSEETIRYISIDLGKVKPSDIQGLSLRFQVSKDLLNQKKLDANSVKLKRFSTSWQVLQTSRTGEDSANFNYMAISPGASIFAVTASRVSDVPRPAAALAVCGDDVCEGNETKQSCCNDCGCEKGYNCALNQFYQSKNIYECKKMSTFSRALLLFILLDILIALAIIFVLIGLRNARIRVMFRVKRYLRQAQDYVDAGDYNGAVESYKDLKKAFESYEDEIPKKERKKMYIQCMSIYDKIADMSKKKNLGLFI